MTEQTEPSMEEILSSIRRILSTEENEKNNTEKKISQDIAEKEEAQNSSDIMELTSDMLLDNDKEEHKDEEPTPVESNSDMELLSEATLNATADRLNDLTEHLIHDEKPAYRSNNSKTLEDFVASLLRPYLKEWLDANLPNIVEKIVSKEVERLTKRTR